MAPQPTACQLVSGSCILAVLWNMTLRHFYLPLNRDHCCPSEEMRLVCNKAQGYSVGQQQYHKACPTLQSSQTYLVVPLGKWVVLVHPQAAEGVVDMRVASLVCPHSQEQLPHASILAQPPVHLCNVGGLQSREGRFPEG